MWYIKADMCLKTHKEKEKMAQVSYFSVIESLAYTMLCIGLDICYVIGLVSRFQSNAGLAIWKVVNEYLDISKR